jgi:F-type H+-transporting ATPase subunit b
VTSVLLLLASPGAAAASEEAEEAAKFLGLPLWIWQLANLVLFVGVLLYFVAKPLGAAFRKRQEQIEERRLEAEKKRATVENLAAEIRTRTAAIEKEIGEIRSRGRADGEEAQRALEERAHAESERIRREAGDEVDRRLATARAELRQAAAALTATKATEILADEITPEDRERLLDDSVGRLENTR